MKKLKNFYELVIKQDIENNERNTWNLRTWMGNQHQTEFTESIIDEKITMVENLKNV